MEKVDDDAKVTRGCGCIFCDIKLKPIKMRRQHIHYVDRRIIVCTEGLKPMSPDGKRV